MTVLIRFFLFIYCVAKTASFLIKNQRQTVTSLQAAVEPVFLYNNVLLCPSTAVSTEKKAPVVILHGLLGAARNFQSWSKLYQQKEQEYCKQQQANDVEYPTSITTTRDCICIDLHNHGRSAYLGSLYMDYTQMARDVRYTLAKLGLTKVRSYPPKTLDISTSSLYTSLPSPSPNIALRN